MNLSCANLHERLTINSGSGLRGLSAQGCANVLYTLSEEFKCKPNVVRSVPSARVVRSGSVILMTLKSPRRPNLSGCALGWELPCCLPTWLCEVPEGPICNRQQLSACSYGTSKDHSNPQDCRIQRGTMRLLNLRPVEAEFKPISKIAMSSKLGVSMFVSLNVGNSSQVPGSIPQKGLPRKLPFWPASHFFP